MPAPPDDARSRLARTVAVEPCGEDAVRLVVRPEEPLPPVRAARFFMLRREDGVGPAIPRPFSLYRREGDDLEFLIQVIGRGTRALAAARPGDPLRLVGPLGNGWPTLTGADPPLVFLAGGVGSAPFLLAAEQAAAGMDGAEPVPREAMTMLYGAATRAKLYDLERFEALGIRVCVATDDGSAGLSGNVLDLLAREQAEGRLPEAVRLFACGPEPMLRAVERFARARGLAAWLSLETHMGCGVGICNGCPVPTRPEGPLGAWPNAKCCVEGPVFSLDAITLSSSG